MALTHRQMLEQGRPDMRGFGSLSGPQKSPQRTKDEKFAALLDKIGYALPIAGGAYGALQGGAGGGLAAFLATGGPASLPVSVPAGLAGMGAGAGMGYGLGQAAGQMGQVGLQHYSEKKRSPYEDEDLEQQARMQAAAALLGGYV